MKAPISASHLPEGPARTLAALAIENGLTIADAIVEGPREASYGALPSRYRRGAAGRFVKAKLGADVEPWRHQSLALEETAKGRNVIVTTPTASGKSLVFQTHALDVASKGGRVIVLYPLKALASDQARSWAQAARMAKVPPEWIGEITGDVPSFLRKDVLEKARIVSMTPDVLHSWLMRTLEDKDVRSFVASVRLVVIDEAHTLDAAFGSSVALLLRRLQVAADICRIKRKEEPQRLSYLAASATMDDPVGHMRNLTGGEFALVSDKDDGSPRHGRTTMHLVPSGSGDEALTSLHKALGENRVGPFVTFCDSRTSVEEHALASGNANVLPYRNGYETADRKRIEDGLREGRIKGVIATSALEMGVDMGRLEVGLNLGSNASRRSLRQRIGRIGRSSQGAFAVVARREDLDRNGESFRDYVTGPVEPCSIYMDNAYLQFQHARCLHAELSALGVRAAGPKRATPAGVDWPSGFADAFASAAPDATPSARYADVAKLDKGSPHLAYGIRAIADQSMEIVTARGQRIGSIGRASALNEAFPEGTYLHMGRRYTVSTWRPGKFSPQIVVRPGGAGITTPIKKSYLNARLEGEGLIDGRRSANGACTEARLRIQTSVIGYNRPTSGESVLYGSGSGSSRKHRHLKTTGVILRLPHLADRPKAKAALGVAMAERFMRGFGISRNDIGIASGSATLSRGSLVDVTDDVLAIHDDVQGSLRLTSRLYENIEVVIRSLLSSGDPSIGHMGNSRFLEEWLDTLGRPAPDDLFAVPEEFQLVEAFPEGTEAIRRVKGLPDLPITLLRPVLTRRNTGISLCYSYSSTSGPGLVADEALGFDGPEPERWDWSHRSGFDMEVASPSAA